MATQFSSPVISGYQISSQLYAGSRTRVYRAIRREEALPVVIKLLTSEYPNFQELLQFRNQYTISKNLNIPGIIHPLSLEAYGNGYILVMPDTGGIALREYIKTTDLSLVEFLAIAIQLTNILHELHFNRVIHKDIKPANILIHPQTKQVQLIDFSIASLLPKETQEIKNPHILEGTLAYISPEQTGRMNRGIDYRSDFYSLGVTFYELLMGELPFICDDPMELVHCHIAKMPTVLGNLEKIPQVLSDIIMKLMAKNAEDRYQNALGLKYDLETCLYQLKNRGKIVDFEIGKRDICDRFLIPEKLYGREKEVACLLQAFERVTNGTSEMMLVAGFSGIGKTAVVNEVHKPITRQQGYFIKGKFDQFNRNLPLSAFVQALRNLIGQLLSESDAQLAKWRAKILEIVGNNGQVLIEMIPEIEIIIGKQPPAPELSGTAAQNRFNLLFQKFIAIFSSPKHPLVVFLDDLQWADSASLQLIKLLMEDRYLLLLGAYRDNEVQPTHPFILTVEELKKAGKTVNTITLAALTFADTNHLVADTLHCTTERSHPLTQLIERKTKGNPFFINQFLKALHEDGLIKFNHHQGYWECDITQINKLSLTDDVVEFMAQQLQKLPSKTQNVLKLAACIGNSFDLETLAIVLEQSAADTAVALWKALQEGLILPQSEVYKFYLDHDGQDPNTANSQNVTYRFLHDRVQQAAYSLIPPAQKQATHYQIGQLLLKQISPAAREERIFELVNQLNYGTAFISQQTERDELAQLNLTACRKARSATAYQAAHEYTAVGLSLLGENAWQRQYKITLALHELAAEVASLRGDSAQMEQLINIVTTQAHSLLEQVNVYRIRIQAYISQNKFTEAIAIAQNILQQLGVTFAAAPTPAGIQQEIQEIRELIGTRKIEDLVYLPIITDELKIAIIEIASSIVTVAYLSGSPLYPLITLLLVKISIQSGNTAATAYIYGIYGVLLCNLLQDVDTATEFGQLALQIVAKLDVKATKPQVLLLLALYILQRKSHIQEILPLLQEGYAIALEVGNLEFAGHHAHNFCSHSFWSGQHLATLEQDNRAYCHELAQLNQLTTANYVRIYWQSTLNLLGFADHPTILSGEALQEKEFAPLLIAANDGYGLYIFSLYKVMLCYLFGEIETAKKIAVEIKHDLVVGAGLFSEPVFYLYNSLIALANLSQNSDEVSAALEYVAENQTKLQQWVQYAPMNHQHKLDLVAAERYRVLGEKTAAIENYDRAIAGAKKHRYIQEEALSNELAAKFYLDWGKEKVAQIYMQEAYYCYARWGAKAKTDDLEKRYPQLLKPILQRRQLTLNPLETIATITRSPTAFSTYTSTTSSTSISDILDFTSILKAAQAISSSIELDELIINLTKIILEISGAKKIVLILPQEHTWQVRAITFISYDKKPQGKIQNLLVSEPIDTCQHIPGKIINYAKNTQETIVIDNYQTDIPGLIDEYILKYKPKSVLCQPILKQGTLVGILYLENQITSGVFTLERLQVINLLSSQAAISLENARLYQQAQQALQDLQAAQLQIVQSEKMSALGNLVAGVAHEMNNPLGFIAATLGQVKPAIADITEHLRLYQENLPNKSGDIIEHAAEIDLDYNLEDLPKMIDAMVMASDRLKNISTSLRTFSRADKDYKVPFDIHQGIDSTILILKHRLKATEQRPAIEVITNYGNLPLVESFPGQLNQVFMNILANAIDALEEANKGYTFEEIQTNPNQITITTSVQNDKVVITIADNGIGMSEQTKQKVFDHLFTTKAVGQGTGLGLAIASQIVSQKHNGSLTVNSQLGKGTEFVITLPILAVV